MRTTNFVHALFGAALDVLESDPSLAARLRAVLGIESSVGDDWIAIAKAPLARKTARRLARTGVIAAKQVSGRWYLSRASLEAYMRENGTESAPAAHDDEDTLRRELGLRGAA